MLPKAPFTRAANVLWHERLPAAARYRRGALQMPRLVLGIRSFCCRLSLNNNDVIINISLYNENTGNRLYFIYL